MSMLLRDYYLTTLATLLEDLNIHGKDRSRSRVAGRIDNGRDLAKSAWPKIGPLVLARLSACFGFDTADGTRGWRTSYSVEQYA